MKIVFVITLFLIAFCCISVDGKMSSPKSRVVSSIKSKGSRPLKSSKKLPKIRPDDIKAELPSIPAESRVGKQKTLQTVLQLGMSVFTMLVSRQVYKLDFKNLDVLRLSRVAFCAYVVLSLVLNQLIVRSIKRSDDQSLLPVKPNANPMMAMIAMLSGKPPMPQTVHAYDLQEADKMTKSIFMQAGLGAVLHLLLKKNAPLLLIPLMQSSSLLQHPLSLIHLFRFKPVDVLQRPFQSAFERFMSTMNLKPVAETDGQTEAGGAAPMADLQALLEKLTRGVQMEAVEQTAGAEVEAPIEEEPEEELEAAEVTAEE